MISNLRTERDTGKTGQQVVKVEFRSGDTRLPGELWVPKGATGLVIFSHGSGSSRFSPQIRYMAEVLHEAGLATLLFDLLTLDEERAERVSAHLRFDLDLLTRRLLDTTVQLLLEPDLQRIPIGYFGSETGCAAALAVAAERPDLVTAIVSRAGRPDLAGPALAAVQAPTLLIVGDVDKAILSVNRQAIAEIPARTELRTITGASHRFEESGAMERVASLACDWFLLHLSSTHLTRR